ncbi:hypothetical protein [Mesobacillus subterraneus]|uniref:SHOCT domain-containing protein n=1 Tax=Mesobacillus subterraneus TaxID=285983 RepID=A0A427TTS7_9BACI|nr:hypothetical protein [Mesobacillus subterraneus]RSD27832.1 hypothetical protein EJA10_08660 [Mesobacillus subterraneus]
MKILHFMLSLTLLFSFQLPDLAKAEDTSNVLKMEEFTIQVMPEYSYHPKDKKKNPPLLVGYHGALKNNATEAQKGKVVIPLPMEDKNFRIGFVADYSRDLTEMNEIEYELDQENGTISWETSAEIQPQEIYKFVVEYYTDSINTKDGSKTLAYEFKSFAEIGLLNLIFVEPLNTDSFKLEPASEQHQKNSYNMNMFLYQGQGMKPGEEKNIKLEYKRAESRTTAEIMEDMAGDAKKAGTVKQNEEIMPLWLVLTVTGSVTLLAAVLLIFFMRRKKTEPVKNEVQMDVQAKKAKLRAMLVEGSITEAEYNELLKKLGGR